MTSTPRVAVIGAGNMGANHARVVAASDRARLALVIDTDQQRAESLAGRYGADSACAFERATECDAVIIAATTERHVELAVPLIDAGVPLLVEKPLADDLQGASRLIEAAAAGEVPLMCGFVERFNPAVLAADGLLEGVPTHIVGLRHSPYNPSIRTSVIDDLLIHDVDLALRLMGSDDIVSAGGGVWSSPEGLQEIADCTLSFRAGGVATLSTSRASQRKVRSLSISAPDALVEIDLLRHDVTVYRHRFAEILDRDGPSYRAETLMEIPFVRHVGEPLAVQFRHFLDLVSGEVDLVAERDTLLAPHRVVQEIKDSVATGR